MVETVLRVFAGTDLAKQRPVEDFEAERDAIDTQLAQIVVTLQIAVRRGLNAYQETQRKMISSPLPNPARVRRILRPPSPSMKQESSRQAPLQ